MGDFVSAKVMSALGQKQTFAVQTGMSASLPKADLCGANADVGYGPKADIARSYSISWSLSPSSCDGIVTPSALAALRLTIKVNLLGCSIGGSAGLAPLRILST